MNAIKNKNQIKIAAIISYFAIFINILAGLIYTPWMIKQIGVSDYGLYTLAISIIAIFTYDFGLGEAVSRFLSKFNVEKNFEGKSNFLGITFKLYFVIDLIILFGFIIIFLFSSTFFAELSIEELVKFRVVFVIAGLYALSSFPFQPFNGILISDERFAFIKITELFHRILTVVTMVVVLILGYKLYALVIVNAISGLVVVIIKTIYINRNKLVKINFKNKDKDLLKQIFIFSGWTAVIGFASRLTFSVSPTILAAVSGTIQITYFGIASIIEGYFFTFSSALNGLFLPRVTQISYESNSSSSIKELMIKVGRIQFVVIGLLFAGFLSVGMEFLTLWLNKDYQIVYFTVLFLITPSLITLTQHIASTALIAQNLVKYRAIGMIIMGIISVGLSLPLSYYWGALGSGIAISVGTFIGLIIYMNFIFSKKLKINLKDFFKQVHLKMIFPFLLVIGFGIILNQLIKDYSWFTLLIKVVSISLVYGLFIWKLSLNDYEKDLIRLPVLKLYKTLKHRIKH